MKVRTSSVKYSSTLLLCSVCAIYHRANIYQKQNILVKSYIPGIDSCIGYKRWYIYFFENQTGW